MKKQRKMYLALCAASAAICIGNTVPALAATCGDVTSVTSDSISGWVWEVGEFDTVLPVEVQILSDKDGEPVEILSATAEQFSQEVSDAIGDGWHAFTIPVDWDEFGDGTFFVRAYSVADDTKNQFGSTFSYKSGQNQGKPVSSTSDTVSDGKSDFSNKKKPDRKEAVSDKTEDDASNKDKPYVELTGSETLLGEFTITGYCGCDTCSGGHNLTYSGTVPKANHTLSADLTLLPIGSKVWIDGIIYTVEDMGGNVNGNIVDIFYDNHEDAISHGTTTSEVYLIES